MQKVKIKIIRFDTETKQLTVAFASDTTKSSDPSDYPSIAFEPFKAWPDAESIDDILKEIARYGMHNLRHVIAEENAAPTAALEAQLNALAGEQVEYDVADLDRTATISTDIQYV